MIPQEEGNSHFLGRPRQRGKTPKIKIEFNDNSGAKYSFSVEGMSKENMVRLMEFVDQVSSQPQQQEVPTRTQPEESSDYGTIDTNFARVYGLLETKFKFGSFTSGDVLEAYELEFDLTTTLSTISTYLSRLTARGLLTRARNGSGWTYKLVKQNPTLIPQEQQETITPTKKDFVLTP